MIAFALLAFTAAALVLWRAWRIPVAPDLAVALAEQHLDELDRERT